MLLVDQQLYFWKSLELTSVNSISISSEIENVIEEVQSSIGKVIAIVGDNARNIQAAIRIITTKFKYIIGVGCYAHLFNLIMGDVFTKLPVAKEVMHDIHAFINDKLIPRYSQTRWTSRFPLYVYK